MRFDVLSLFPLSFLQTPWLSRALSDEAATYDYIIIGGGNAGLAVASRLSEDPQVTVAVLEAGLNAENLAEVFIPGLVGMGVAFTKLNWAYETVPQEHLNGRIAIINAGKALGGGTIINSMIFPRAEKEQYDAWGALNNNDPHWTWSALLPFFKKSELFTPPNAEQTASGVQFEEDVHGTDTRNGRVKVGYPNYFYIQSEMWRNASGLRQSSDLSNGRPQGTMGISPNTLDAQNNTRCSSACAYYTPFADRPNLTVLTNVFVTRILWTPSSLSGSTQIEPLKADGVEYRTGDGRLQHVNVRKEVVVSAGTLASPRILEHSGVGNSTILRNAGVLPVLSLPTIGENLADHVHGWTNAFTNASVTRDLLKLDPAYEKEQTDLWFLNRTGVLSAAPRSLGLTAASDLFPSSQLAGLIQETATSLKHYARAFSNGNKDLAKGIEAQHTLTLDLWRQNRLGPVEINVEPGYAGPTAFADRPQEKYTAINAVLFSPFSRGRIHINSSNPLDPSEIDPAYYAHPLDLSLHVKGIQLGRKILQTSPLDSIFQGEFEPGSDKTTDADVAEWSKSVSASDNHVVGTMAMMPKELGGVVDTRLKIYGIQNVRVIDASIIPMPISAHLCSTVYAIAERGAEFMIEDAHHL